MTNNKPAPILTGEEAKRHLDLISRCYVNEKTATDEQRAAFARKERGYYKAHGGKKEVWCVFDNSTGYFWTSDVSCEADALLWLQTEAI